MADHELPLRPATLCWGDRRRTIVVALRPARVLNQFMPNPWYLIENAAEIPTPALVVYPDRVDENLRRMVVLAGGVERLRPHVKTHKMPDVVRRKLALGITKFKCATIAEAEMVAGCGAPDVLVAYQLVGPNAARFARLVAAYPETRFSTIADDATATRELSAALAGALRDRSAS